MSDVSEHESDSDTEKESSSSTAKKEDTTTELSTNIVEELKKQAEGAQSTQEQPAWEKYMQQNEQTGQYTYTDPNDGTVYEWDPEKRGWIPKIDDDFIAMYQANYGFNAAGEPDPNVNVPTAPAEEACKEEKKKKVEADDEKGKKRKLEEPKWFDADPKNDNNVYVAGLPLTTTEEEFVELMSKYGIIMADDQGKLKVKMYKSADGQFKGDARCCYLKHESVVLACELLDENDFNGSKLSVEKAVFQLKGEFNPALKPKKKKKKKKKGGQEKLLDWVDRPAKRSKFDRIVIFKNMFECKEFEKDPTLINDLKGDLRSGCEKFGEIKKVLVFDRNPEGVASILFHEPEFADKCIEAMNGRFYAGRTISAETYDGVTNYQVEETEEEFEKRVSEWERFIAEDEEKTTE
ncbi:HIV Tat-specific factor 1 homolog [Hydractinia symbiolongicarpus]|uniref:HIV Tat-specific factor 1 homolog n=1 Tax=Hydractinia symbiolongicarpus TaxID=13093 RepID=UPI002550B1DD|nr:HIV Tat-specific factor 1 homolog [Hydractinia symbiolongicarpus]XP_057306509.1 HIV Tat-specific factor 1 homolog [Hydractinia symbiolongicarpus]